MPTFLKHVGQVASTGKKCVVVFRSIPNDPSSCLIVETERLDDLYHSDLQSAVESIGAQETVDFYVYAQRSIFHDGRNMLEALHTSKWLKKVSTNDVTMMPSIGVSIQLDDLNRQLEEINKSKDVSKTTMSDISRNIDAPAQGSNPAGVLDDKQLADNMRAQAMQFQAEATRLLKEADELSPAQEVLVAEAPSAKRKYTKKK